MKPVYQEISSELCPNCGQFLIKHSGLGVLGVGETLNCPQCHWSSLMGSTPEEYWRKFDELLELYKNDN